MKIGDEVQLKHNLGKDTAPYDFRYKGDWGVIYYTGSKLLSVESRAGYIVVVSPDDVEPIRYLAESFNDRNLRKAMRERNAGLIGRYKK